MREVELKNELSRCQDLLKSTKQEVNMLTTSLADSERSFLDRLKEMETKHLRIVQQLEQKLQERDKELQAEIENAKKITVQVTWKFIKLVHSLILQFMASTYTVAHVVCSDY